MQGNGELTCQLRSDEDLDITVYTIVKLRQGSGKDRQGMVEGERP